MNKRKKIIWTVIGAAIILVAAGDCVFAYKSRADPEIETVITTEYVFAFVYTEADILYYRAIEERVFLYDTN